MNKDQYVPYLNLANAIVEQAVIDYRINERKRKRTAAKLAAAEKKLAKAKLTGDENLIKSAEEQVERRWYRANEVAYEQWKNERFFRSDWFAILSDLDGELLLAELQAETKKSG